MTLKRLLTTVAAVFLLAAGYAAWYLLPTSVRFYTDADTIRQPLERARTRDILWQPPVKLTDIINSSADDYEPRMSADGLTMFFVRGKAGENADIYTARRTTDGWTNPEPLTAINTAHEELGPEPTADGQSIYFYSDRPGGLGGYDIWVSHLGTSGWRTPVNLGPMLNTGHNEYGPALTPDGGTLYFSSNRPRAADRQPPDQDAWPATVREDLFQRDYDLYASSITDAGASKANAITELNTPYNEGRAAVSSFGDFLYFGSDRPGGEGGFDIYRSRRRNGTLQPAENLGDAVNSPANELDAGLSLGGFGLYFSSDRDARDGERYDIFYTTSREVFVDAESHQRTIDWAALWAIVGPNLLWALLALLLLLTLLALLRGMRDRKLSLLARCVLVSLFAHLLMMLLFNFWQVTAGIARAMQGKGAIRVALVSAEDSGNINTQIRGRMTTVEMPDTPAVTSSHPPLSVHIDDAAAILTVKQTAPENRDQPQVDTRFHDATPPSNRAPPAVQQPAAIEHDAADIRLAAFVEEPNDSVSEDAPRAPRPEKPVALRSLGTATVISEGDARQQEEIPPTETTRSTDDASLLSAVVAPDHRLKTGATLSHRLKTGATLSHRLKTGGTLDHRLKTGATPDPALPPHAAIELSPLEEPSAERSVEKTPAERIVPQAASPRFSQTPDALRDALSPANGMIDLTPQEATDDRQPLDAPSLAGDGWDRDPPAFAALVPLTRDWPALDLSRQEPKPDRSLRLYADEKTRDAIGTITGNVTDADTGEALPRAAIRIDLPDRSPETVTTGAAGDYVLFVPDVPEHFAMSVSLDGYVPAAADISADELEGTTLERDFKLHRIRDDIIPVEASPVVHHLGNDRFEGRVNSQFQRDSEGEVFAARFRVALKKRSFDPGEVLVSMLTKGVQCPLHIHINGAFVAEVDNSPRDGSFGLFTASLDRRVLRDGVNTIAIEATRCRGDLDDFEFINIQIHLSD